MARKYSSKNSDTGMNIIMIAVIAVVLVLGVVAVYGTVKGNIRQNSLDSYNATITQRADALGLEADEFLSLYGLSESGLKGSDNEQSAYEKMTLSNYIKYVNGTAPTQEELDEFKTAMGLEDDDTITLDTTDMSAKTQYASYLQSLEDAENAEDTDDISAEDEPLDIDAADIADEVETATESSDE